MSDEMNTEKKEDWMNSKWRPMMGWMYMLVCTMDFVVFPILWSLVQTMHGGQVSSQWNPITLQGAGLFHMAMGAILGIAAFGRTQEKLAGANNGGLNVTTPTPPAPAPAPFPSAPAPAPVAAAPAPSPFPSAPTPAPVVMSSSGKPGPAPVEQPIL